MSDEDENSAAVVNVMAAMCLGLAIGLVLVLSHPW
jgi:hypothetical protein